MIDVSEKVASGVFRKTRRTETKITSRAVLKRNGIGPKRMLPVERVFSDPRTNPFAQLEWEWRTAEITDDAGKVTFKQDNVAVPKSWSLLATKVVGSNYSDGEQGTPQ